MPMTCAEFSDSPTQRMQHLMPEASSAGGYAAYKLAIALGLPAGLAAIVVMLWAQPQSKREWAMALITTVMSSIGGGAAVVQYMGWQDWGDSYLGLIAVGGIIFACGLPGWVVVRAAFAWAEKRKGKDLGELARDAADTVKDLA